MNELSHTLALKRIRELEAAMKAAAIALEEGHFDRGGNLLGEWDSEAVSEAHAVISEALGWTENSK